MLFMFCGYFDISSWIFLAYRFTISFSFSDSSPLGESVRQVVKRLCRLWKDFVGVSMCAQTFSMWTHTTVCKVCRGVYKSMNCLWGTSIKPTVLACLDSKPSGWICSLKNDRVEQVRGQVRLGWHPWSMLDGWGEPGTLNELLIHGWSQSIIMKFA
jgi:hypothetical protein